MDFLLRILRDQLDSGLFSVILKTLAADKEQPCLNF